jgi:hypothetical protein
MANSVGKSTGEMILAAIRIAFPPGDPERLFIEWLVANSERLREACVELGIEPPEPGPELYQRLKTAVIAKLGQDECIRESAE